jgi:outer membrane protein W
VEVGAGLTGIQFDYKVSGSQYAPYSYEQKLSYIEIPVLARYYFAPKKSIRPYIQGGVTATFSLYKKEKSKDFGNYWLTEDPNSNNILATFRTDMENLGFVMGGGVAYNLKKISIRADIRYTHHLNSSNRLSKFDDITGYEDIPSSEKFGYTNDIILITVNDLQISLGLVYYLKYKVF